MPSFGENLKAFRASRPEGASLDDFYEKFGVSGATGSRYESGKTEPTFSFLQELAAEYGPEVAHLMPGNPAAGAAGKIDGETLEAASQIVDRVVIEGRNVAATVRWELVSLVAAELLDLRALGRESEIEEKVRRWLGAARAGLGASAE